MNWPTLKIPQEFSKVTAGPGPVLCRACGKTGEPNPALTCLGDLVLRMGGFCPSCRVLCCLLEITPEIAAKVPPSRFVAYDQKFPEDGVSFPRPRYGFFSMSDFPYGANERREGA